MSRNLLDVLPPLRCCDCKREIPEGTVQDWYGLWVYCGDCWPNHRDSPPAATLQKGDGPNE